MRFTKYEDRGAYHWKDYLRGTKYKKHADRIKKWVTEKKVLDVGAGDGLITFLVGATGIDNEPKAIELAQALGIDVQQGDAYSLPYKDDEFEAVLMADVLEHFDEPEKALAEARRVAPVLYITTPERGMVNDKFHVREWLRGELPIFMEENGYTLDGEVLVVPEEKNMYARFIRSDTPKTSETLSILIPARNEEWLPETLEDLLKNIRGKTDIFVCLDGEWHDKEMPQDPRITYVYRHESWGQRKATNQLCKLSDAKYVMKVDAHCAFDEGFDVKLMQDMQDDWTVVPTMRNLHVFDWVCTKCGAHRYQGPSGECEKCGGATVKEVIWNPKGNPQSTSYCFDTEMHFQYFHEYKKVQRESGSHLVETMSLQGSCFMLTREKYWELNICDEEFGSWGAQGTEVACKTWLSGGKCIVNTNTWYAHLFRTQGGDFSFPYKQDNKQVESARRKSQVLFLDNKWPQQVKPLSWLIDKFAPVPYWHNVEDKTMLKAVRMQPLMNKEES